ncbi:MAG: FAD-linked oxidase C-terminal domain-containing protein [Candidatus Latescibacterota bacterium]|nr:FAD-linked oxidase C-terminal domain-containing protein [Candidatus Latescibacterota bacterium]
MASIADRLQALIPADRVLDSPEDLSVYAFDGTATLHELPGCVVMVNTAAEVSQVLTLASELGIPVVTRGSGTGLAGGSVPVAGCIVLCLVNMNRILEVDVENLTMTVEPGVITKNVAAAAAEAGLFYPPDPGSIKISTIGGNVANNSGGLRGLKYGVTRDYVMALEVVLADGRILETGTKCVKDVAGFSMRDLFIGSEGSLGVITRIILKLIPPPASKATLLGLFDSITAAAETIAAIIRNRIIPCTLEFLDRVTVGCVEDYAQIGLPRDVEAVTLMEVDGHAAAVEEEAQKIEAIAGECGAREVRRARSTAEAEQLASARRIAFSSLARLAPTVILEDITVPRSELPRMMEHIQQVAVRYNVRIGTFGHMGDGNLHPTFLTDERDVEEMERVERAMTEVFEIAVTMGGTITGEHGVGLAKKRFLPNALGPVGMASTRALKATFDPQGILNPGKIFDPH